MGTTTRTVLTDAISTEVVTSISVEKGTLVAVCCHDKKQRQAQGTNIASLEIATGDPGNLETVAILAQGEIGGLAAVSWTGEIKMDATYQLVCRAYGLEATSLRFCVVTQD